MIKENAVTYLMFKNIVRPILNVAAVIGSGPTLPWCFGAIVGMH